MEDKYTDSESLVKWINQQMKLSKSQTSDWREQVIEDYDFYSGEQWSQEDKSKLESQGRIPVVFNRVARTINAVSGLEVQNRQEVRYIPRETTDNQLADYYSAIVKWARDQTDAEDEDSEAFQDALICGMGWTQTRLEYDVDPEGMIEVSRFDPGEAFWDCHARKKNIVDTKWRARVKRYYSADEVRQVFPEYQGSEKPIPQWIDDQPKVGDGDPPGYRPGNNNSETDKKAIEVVCFNYYDNETYYRVATPDGVIELSEEKKKILEEHDLFNDLQSVKQKRRKYRIAYVCGDELLDLVESPVQTGFLFNCITGLRDRNTNTWFGLMRLMVDPQRWANKWLSQIMHILNSNAKGGLLAEKGAFENQRKAEDSWADPQAITWVKDGAIVNGKVKEKSMPAFPQGFAQLFDIAVQSISDTPGVNAELMGVVERNQPGVLEMTRKQAGVTMLGVFFDSLRRYRKEQGRVLADLVRDYISDGRKIRIIGPEGNPEVITLMKEAMAFNYDIVVDDAPNSPSMRDKVFQVLQALMPQLAALGIKPPAEFIDYMPLPASLTTKWKEQMKPNPMAEQIQQQGMALEFQEKGAEIAKDLSQAELNKAKALETQQKARNDAVETGAKVMMLRTGQLQRAY
jgi:hypothetical protein